MLEEGRRRLGLLALLMAFAFAVDPFFYALTWVLARTGGRPLEPGYLADLPFYLGDLVVVALSLCLGFAARSGRVIREAARLLDAGLVYEVALCFWLALRTYWEYFHDTGMLPNLTWVPAVIILFPLIVPARAAAHAGGGARLGRHAADGPLPPRSRRPAGGGRRGLRERGGRLRHRRGVRRHGLACRPPPAPGGVFGPGTGRLSPRGEAGPGRHGRGVARPPPVLGAAGGDQADPARRSRATRARACPPKRCGASSARRR